MPGVYTFEYAVIPHAVGQEGFFSRLAYRHAYAFNAPMRAIGVPMHFGELSPESSLVRVSPQAFVISSIKSSEDGRGWIVRGYNLTASPLEVSLVPWRPFQTVQRVGMDEEAIESLSCAEDGRVSLPVSGYEILTVKFSV
jgi:alpha-mannosidase